MNLIYHNSLNDENILVPENLTWNSKAPVNPDENGLPSGRNDFPIACGMSKS